MKRLFRISPLCLVGFGLCLMSVGLADDKPAFDDASIEFFEKEVRPILIFRCLECHTSGEKAPKGGLRLDSRDAVLKGGDTGPAVTLDKPNDSLFISAINYGDIYQMPPKSKLPANEIAVLTKWIERGLPWPKEKSTAAGTVKPFDLVSRAAEHWCWQPLKDHAAPAVAASDWPITDIDRFILAKLESRSLQPAPPADKRALLRRVYFDLIGLPPSPEDVEAFAHDNHPQAFERVVDSLLGSVHFGERWARHWLDLARYAETRGHEFEPIIPNAWQYRDYVIRALNADVPYDRFLTEQIAGDLVEPRWRAASEATLPSPSLPINEALLGTGLWFLGEEVHSPVDIRKDETDRIDNRLDVLSKTFLGLTIACARCHDHKFDAISQRDYYALAGYAISGSYRQVRVETVEQHRRIAQQLDALRNQARQAAAKEIAEATAPILDNLNRYWLTARRALDEGVALPATGSPEPALEPDTINVLTKLAAESSLDASLLGRWCAELNSAKTDPQHPLHGLFGPVTSNPASSATNTSIASTTTTQPEPGLVVDFGDAKSYPPIQDGVSFGLRPVERGQFVISGSPEAPTFGVATISGWDRDLFWKGLTLTPGTEVDNGALGSWQMYGRKVRSPEFTLTTHRLWYLVRGSVRAYATVNSHLIIVGPLHGSLLTEFKQTDDEWHWVSHGLDLYQGHRMHVEFSPIGDGPCSIAKVVQSEEQPKPVTSTWQNLRESFAEANDVEGRLAGYKSAFHNAARSLSDTTSDSTPRPDQAELANWFVKHLNLFSTTSVTRTIEALAKAEAELARQVRWDSSLAPAIQEGNGVDEFLLVRGNSTTPKEPVPRRFLEAFDHVTDKPLTRSQTASNQTTGSGRLELARNILHSPLASRVAVNRIWHHLFGRGIVPTVDNLGVLGLPPSHPELLDHLALQFTRNGWSTKALIRSLVLSRTYQISSYPTAAETFDPANELWHRMPLKRLEGEAIRDSLLAVSGRLDRTPFGPSVPIHLTEFMQGRGRPGASGPLDGNGRRSIYISVRRNFLSPMMMAFDTPNPFSTVGRRTVSNVPAQALILMNDPFVIEQANRWADRVAADPAASFEQRIDRMYLTAFARHPTGSETADAISFLNSQGVSQSESQTQAWRSLCHVMFNVKEFVFIE
jgi:hypothetical protein